jgi:aminoglycoside/choline kinase family phosphotransferase
MNIEENIRYLFRSEDRNRLHISPIQGDASTRQYYRVSGSGGTAIACHDPLLHGADPYDYPFLVMHRILSEHGLPVPQLLAVSERKGLLLLEDCGTVQLQDIADSGNPSAADLYHEIIDMLAKLQSITGKRGKPPFSLSFDREKLMFEFDFFIEHALLGYFAPVSGSVDTGMLRSEFETIADILVQPEQFVLNHRDFHSRNIMIRNGKPVIIDFQDARMGLPQYDAVSLIRDSYVKLDPLLANELKARHYRVISESGLTVASYDEYLYLFDIMAFQRNVKALGTFCYQTAVLRKAGYEQSIAPTIAYLSDYTASRNELKKAGKLLRPVIEGAFIT